MQGRGIGTKVLDILLTRAADQSKAMTLAVVKINPARHFYEKRGFRITHEDQHKFLHESRPKKTSPGQLTINLDYAQTHRRVLWPGYANHGVAPNECWSG
jgi:N-acetylglutamate synthase-like GNAT family acetyltransferase